MDGSREQKVAELIGSIAKVVEESGINYLGATIALRRLLEHYESEGTVFLNTANIKDVAWHRQRLFEQKNATPSDKGVAAQECSNSDDLVET